MIAPARKQGADQDRNVSSSPTRNKAWRATLPATALSCHVLYLIRSDPRQRMRMSLCDTSA